MTHNIVDIVLRQYSFHLAYARELVADLDETQMQSVPGIGHENHPTFVLGHLVAASAMICDDLGLERDLPDGWRERFERAGPSDRRLPTVDPSAPSKRELLDELARQHGRVEAALPTAKIVTSDEPVQWRLDEWMPTGLDAIVFLCTAHEAMHLGQLAAWRRAMNLPAAMAKMGRHANTL